MSLLNSVYNGGHIHLFYINVYSIFFCHFEFRNPLAQMEDEKRDHDNKLKKMETEMEQVFEMKVKEKKQKLKDSEIAVSV